jgi:hypothetical protein
MAKGTLEQDQPGVLDPGSTSFGFDDLVFHWRKGEVAFDEVAGTTRWSPAGRTSRRGSADGA